MSVTTSSRLNSDQIAAALPAGSGFVSHGADLTSAQQKVIDPVGCDDTALQAAITTAAGQFVDRAANFTALQAKAQQALNANATFQAIASPTNAQNAAQVQALTKQANGIIRLLLNAVDTTAGT